jgi:hypothetical protein
MIVSQHGPSPVAVSGHGGGLEGAGGGVLQRAAMGVA